MPLCSEKVIIKDSLIKVGHFKHLEKKDISELAGSGSSGIEQTAHVNLPSHLFYRISCTSAICQNEL